MKRNLRKEKLGKVVSDKSNKTITVMIDRKVKHPIYGKYINKSIKLSAHDEENKAQEGDFVQIMETRPLSKTKKWRLVKILKTKA